MRHRVSALSIAALWTAAAAAAATTIPIDMSSGRPVVEISVHGRENLKMVLDTGAGGSVIDGEIARRLGLEVIGEDRVGDPSGRNKHTVQRVVLSGIRLGTTVLGDIEAVALDLPAAFGHGQRPFDGVLSVRSLAPHLVTLDLSAGELRLSEGRLDVKADHVVPYYEDEMEIPWVQVLVGPLTVKGFLDTGNPGFLSLPKPMSKHLDLATPLEVVGKGKTVSNTFEISAAMLDGAVTLAGHSIDNPTINFDELHRGTQANIGSRLLSRFVVTLDQRSRLVRFEPTAPQVASSLASID